MLHKGMESVQGQLQLSSMHQLGRRDSNVDVVSCPVMQQGLRQGLCEGETLGQMSSVSIFQGLIKPLYTTIRLQMIVCCLDVLYPLTQDKRGKIE